MSSHAKRLTTLEAEHGIGRQWTDDDEDHFDWMTGPPLITVIFEYGRYIAQRRWLMEHNHVAGRPHSQSGGSWIITRGDGWGAGTTYDERDALTLTEVQALGAMFAERELHDALRIWTNEPDERGWPPLGNSPMGYAEFMGSLTRERKKLAVHRSSDGRHGIEWRRRHPAWHPDMTSDEYDAWEIELTNEGATDEEAV